MASNNISNLNRRRILQGIAATGAVGLAGCLNGENGEADVDVDDALERNEVDIDAIQEGGRLEFALPRDSIDDYDWADSSAAEDSVVFDTVYDGLTTADSTGETHLWMAEEYEPAEANDVSVEDYAEYMVEMEPESVEDGVPSFDLDENNLVIMQHPDDEPEEGEPMRVLTRDEAADAVEDGTFGIRLEGRLHEGIEFHNGEEVTAENVVRSYDRFVGSVNEGQWFDSFLHATAPDGDDGYTFELYAQEADAAAYLELPPYIFPSEHFDVPAGDLDPRDDGDMVPVGTGPYEIAEFEEGSRLLLERTDNYWVEEVGLENIPWYDGPEDFPERPAIEEINIRFVDDSAGRSNALEDGDVDIAYELPSEARNNFHSSESFAVSANPAFGFKFMQFPVEDTDEGGAFAQREVRQAVSALIPRQQIVDLVEQGWGDPARAPIPEPASGMGTAMDYEDLESQDWAYNVEPDPEEAEALLEEAGLERPVEVTVETNSDDEERIDKMELVVDQLNESGLFDAELETPAALGDWTAELYEDGARHDSAERNAAAVIGLAGTPDPHGFHQVLHHPRMHNGCCNFFFPEGALPEEFIEQMESCRFGVDVAEDPDTRRQAYDEFWPEVADLSANVIVDYSLNTGTVSNDVVGFNVHPQTQAILRYALYNPADQQITYLDR
ncbi:ABC transporter substrate-binding protein [Natronobacterium gregoryi]|uniref:ABC transporter substrate-binding protein n=2 Tax=Natronobacterium gregoryi TaxID=44930 RepID=L0ADQ5_NATGS|nr:ABC transporter substrate-binding protein [Natronobacterium gregoryi]AFZ72038.1 ABC-type dipeptide transport system, periplasmic component [Natronobacterium gregoryi SP2]ELY62686.1 family 5 extracellular solute-binding protein [Natronobacterium gregoryi SP2]PLK20887.1 ABC transporter substrate-binding protein [Natronobacterium gregoryi SP2]SFJ20451.1 ABC-type transport system, substrate-binding protein [Natronobacterium gregoryi]